MEILIKMLCHVGSTTILFPGFGVIINIVSKDDVTYRVTIGNIPRCICLDSIKMSSQTLGKKGNGCIINIFIMSSKFLCKVGYESNKFIHGPTFNYNKAMQLLGLVGVDECE